MADVKKKVVEVDVKAQKIGELKEQIKELTRLMDSLDKESLEYNRTVDMLVEAEEELTTVMKVGKSQLSAQEGSYNALVNKMAALKKAQKAVTDEASRMRLGDKIREINDELKRIDENNGVYVRNVGNYENAVKKALKTPQQELKALRIQLAQLEQGTAEYNATFARMAQLTHDVTEQQEMLRWSSADLGDILGNVAGIATSVAGGFSAFNALGGLLGMGENEDLEKAMLQAQRFLQLVQGLEQLEQLADKIKGLWKGINNYNTTVSGSATILADFETNTKGAAGATQTLGGNLNAVQGAAQSATVSIEEAAAAMSEIDMAAASGSVSLEQIQRVVNEQIDGLANYARELSNATGENIKFQGSAGNMMLAFDDMANITANFTEEEKKLAATNTRLLKTNLQLKDTLQTTHKWQILTRAATKAQIKENEALVVGNTLLASSFKVAAVAANVLKVAIISTGIGALLVLIGGLINSLAAWVSGSKKAEERTNALKESVDGLNESLAAQEKAWDRQEMLLEAQGKSYEEIYEARRKNLQAQLAEASALLASQKAIAEDIGQRKLQKKKYDEFRETLEELTQREKDLKTAIEDLDYEKYIQGIKDKKKAEEDAANAQKRATEQAIANYNKEKEEADKLYKSLIEHFKDEKTKLKEKYEEEKALLEKYGKDTTNLTKKYEQDKTAIVMKEAEARRRATEEYNKLLLSGMDNPSLEYFVSQLEDAVDKYNAFMTANSKVARDENGTTTLTGYAEVIEYISEQYGINIKSVKELDAWLKVVTKEYEDAKKALEDYKTQLKETTSAELVAEIEAQIAAIQKLMEQKQLEADQEYLLYESSNNYYTDFENNYISQMYKRWEAEDAIHKMRMENLQEMADKYKEASENTMLTEEARLEALAKYKEIEQQIINETTEHNINANYRETEEFDNYATAVQDSLSGISQILGDVANAWETSIQAQIDAGEISEEEGEKQMESMRGIQSAIALINALSSAVSAYNSMASIPYVGPALGAAAAAAALASGIAQVVAINKVKKGDKGGSESSRYAEVTPTQTDYNPQGITNVTGEQETQNLANAMTKSNIWVSVKDIDAAQSKVKTRDKEATF